MKQKIIIDPVTRIEGHLKVEVQVDSGKVVDAKCTGSLYRGFEQILQGRDPRDAQQITQRICGVCPTSHGTAAVLAIDSILDAPPPSNGRILRNLIFGADFLQSHILNFYHLVALDYVQGPDIPPFTPRYEGDYRLPSAVNKATVDHYLQALDMRKLAHEMLAIFGGKTPHTSSIVPGGVTEQVDAQKVLDFKYRLKILKEFIEGIYLPDVYTVAEYYQDWFSIGKGCGNLLAFGGLPLTDDDVEEQKGQNQLFKRGIYYQATYGDFDPALVQEDIHYSWYVGEDSSKHPRESLVLPQPKKDEAYSWLRSPRYDGKVYEVGPLARMWINKHPKITTLGSKAFSVMGRHAARAEECLLVANAMEDWLGQLQPSKIAATPYTMPQQGEGMGLTEAPRGALGHWMKVEQSVIAKYNAVVPTTWNASPKDDQGLPGPIEQALIGTPIANPKHPIEVVRIIRSFDPCLGCAVHLLTPSGSPLAHMRVG
ncbi:MAG: nickel-dependent hydrogenase large subunit [Thermincolia bacterium]